MSAERNEPPDIDVDFEHERREEVIQYIYDKYGRSEEHTSELQSLVNLVCRLLLEKKKSSSLSL